MRANVLTRVIPLVLLAATATHASAALVGIKGVGTVIAVQDDPSVTALNPGITPGMDLTVTYFFDDSVGNSSLDPSRFVADSAIASVTIVTGGNTYTFDMAPPLSTNLIYTVNDEFSPAGANDGGGYYVSRSDGFQVSYARIFLSGASSVLSSPVFPTPDVMNAFQNRNFEFNVDLQLGPAGIFTDRVSASITEFTYVAPVPLPAALPLLASAFCTAAAWVRFGRRREG
ncbi:MAG: hypothetical protein H6978_16660 [Gammaproteobacteria bacterium]|nr:hypothetical protein [Gammaproteobacteria bacterium]MCP5146443.1 hypothetical protein [Gammaproteobacteria bacterium]